MPAFLDNDANVAALAEALVGAGKGLPSIFYTTISTGIGGCAVIDGKTVSGKHGFGKRQIGTIPANAAICYHIRVEDVN